MLSWAPPFNLSLELSLELPLELSLELSLFELSFEISLELTFSSLLSLLACSFRAILSALLHKVHTNTHRDRDPTLPLLGLLTEPKISFFITLCTVLLSVFQTSFFILAATILNMKMNTEKIQILNWQMFLMTTNKWPLGSAWGIVEVLEKGLFELCLSLSSSGPGPGLVTVRCRSGEVQEGQSQIWVMWT